MSSTISKMTKETFGVNEAIAIGDFAKDYQFLIQDEVQSYHWSKEYGKLHPLVLYYLDKMMASNMIHCVLFLMTTSMIQAFCIKFKQCLLIILKLITHT